LDGEYCNNIISGTPTSAGTHPFTVQTQLPPNSLGSSATVPLVLKY
jgi:hypothetical protein